MRGQIPRALWEIDIGMEGTLGARQCPRILAVLAGELVRAGRVTGLSLGLFLNWRLFFAALRAD
jgi:hypothetical protein